eukprot:scaffold120759_cov75-Phaeocystis_antarctica.AAC.3
MAISSAKRAGSAILLGQPARAACVSCSFVSRSSSRLWLKLSPARLVSFVSRSRFRSFGQLKWSSFGGVWHVSSRNASLHPELAPANELPAAKKQSLNLAYSAMHVCQFHSHGSGLINRLITCGWAATAMASTVWSPSPIAAANRLRPMACGSLSSRSAQYNSECGGFPLQVSILNP